MKICYTIARYWPAIGGAEIHTHMLIEKISKEHNVEIVTQTTENGTGWLTAENLYVPREAGCYQDNRAPVHVLSLTPSEATLLQALIRSTRRTKGVWRASSLVTEMVLKKKMLRIARDWDIIHSIRAGSEYLNLCSRRVARTLDIPYVFTPIAHLSGDRVDYFRMFRKLYQKADALIAMTEYEKQWLITQGADPRNVHSVGVGPVLPDAFDGRRFRERYEIDGYIVLFIGQKYRYKGYVELLQASREVQDRFPNTCFVFIGPRTPESRISFFPYADHRIIELGVVSDQEKADALAACDIFCMPSLQESFGSVFLEAWMMGKPVIAGDIPCERELVDDGEDGFLVRQDPGEIAGRIMDLLGDEKLRERMGRSGREKVLQRYTWDRIAEKMMAIYDGLSNATKIRTCASYS